MFFRHGILFFFLIEAFTLMLVIGQIGFFKTLLITLCTAACGVILIQRQGLAMLMNVQKSFNKETVPVDKFFDGLCLVVAGLLLIIPGFIGDIFAVLLLIPAIRARFKDSKYNFFAVRTASTSPYGDDVIDGSYVRVEESVEIIEQDSENDRKRLQ